MRELERARHLEQEVFAPRSATIWTPTGKPVASSWGMGIEIAGWPVTLNTDVNTAIG
ncbi:hypothetical protein ACWDBO_14415 [Streptomyces mirabilis]|uniref:hypothetical protein n=1 Tax=Streptomyces mirabilis TaxID=68239 RepID=UPI003320091F